MQGNAHDAARMLWTCRQSGTVIEGLPAELRPRDTAMAHAIQAALPDVAGQRVVGWKIAATSAAGQAHIQVDGPLAGRILESFVNPVVTSLTLAGDSTRAAGAWEFRPPSSMPDRGLGIRLGRHDVSGFQMCALALSLFDRPLTVHTGHVDGPDLTGSHPAGLEHPGAGVGCPLLKSHSCCRPDCALHCHPV